LRARASDETARKAGYGTFRISEAAGRQHSFLLGKFEGTTTVLTFSILLIIFILSYQNYGFEIMQ
jgi:hypothetical protein